ncbi:MAG: hypothetical protein ABI999_14130 [Acidobacteriota bacterium]
MDWTIKWLDSAEYFQVDMSGVFSLADARSASSDIVAQPFWNNGTSVLIDTTGVVTDKIGASDIEFMILMMEPLDAEINGSKVALVGGSDILFGLARQFQTTAEGHISADIRPFRLAQAAVEWLTQPALPASIPKRASNS